MGIHTDSNNILNSFFIGLFIAMIFSLPQTAYATESRATPPLRIPCDQILQDIYSRYNPEVRNREHATISFNSPVITIGSLLWNVHHSKAEKQELKKRELEIDSLANIFRSKKCALPKFMGMQNSVMFKSITDPIRTESVEPELVKESPQILEFPSRCTNAVDRTKRTYEIKIDNLKRDEYLRFYTVGPNTRSVTLKAKHLTLSPINLPTQTISSRKGGIKRGLWVERLATGEKRQLNYLPPWQHCNSKGTLTVNYSNFWIVANEI